MARVDRAHLARTQQAAAGLDDGLRALDHRDLGRADGPAAEAADLVRFLKEQGDYWEQSQAGRLGAVKRLLAKLVRPFFAPQVRYNLLLAETLGRVELALAELRMAADAETETDVGPGPAAVGGPRICR